MNALRWLTGTLDAYISKQEIFTLKKLSNLEKLLKLLVNVHVNIYWLCLIVCVCVFFFFFFFFLKVKNLSVRELYIYKKQNTNERDVTQDVLFMALITHYALGIFKKTKLHALCDVFEHYHVEVGVFTTKNSITGSFDIVINFMRS